MRINIGTGIKYLSVAIPIHISRIGLFLSNGKATFTSLRSKQIQNLKCKSPKSFFKKNRREFLHSKQEPLMLNKSSVKIIQRGTVFICLNMVEFMVKI